MFLSLLFKPGVVNSHNFYCFMAKRNITHVATHEHHFISVLHTYLCSVRFIVNITHYMHSTMKYCVHFYNYLANKLIYPQKSQTQYKRKSCKKLDKELLAAYERRVDQAGF